VSDSVQKKGGYQIGVGVSRAHMRRTSKGVSAAFEGQAAAGLCPDYSKYIDSLITMVRGRHDVL